MQERYLGDSHDFLKYALLRRINATAGLRLGVNWYLTKPEQVDQPGNNDGEKRHHLKGGVWQEADLDLFDRIRRFDIAGSRILANVADWQLLPSETIYFDEYVDSTDRQGWHERAMSSLSAADVVFLDPDNGFEVRSMTSRTQPKYTSYSEVSGYLTRGQAVLAIQFARQCDPVARAFEVRNQLIATYGKAAKLPVIRGRVAPNILFFAIAPDDTRSSINTALREFADRCAKVDLIE